MASQTANFRECKNAVEALVSWIKNKFKCGSPEELLAELKRNDAIITNSLCYISTCPDDFEEAFPFHWKMLYYRLIDMSRKPIRELNKKLAVAEKKQLKDEQEQLRKALFPHILTLVVSCNDALCFYGKLTKALLECAVFKEEPLPEADKALVTEAMDAVLSDSCNLVDLAGLPEMPKLSSISRAKLVAILSRGCIFVGDAIRYVVQNVRAEMHPAIAKASFKADESFKLNNVSKRFTMGNVLQMYSVAARLCPGSGNPHNQLAAIFLSLKHEWMAMVSYIRAIDVTDSPFSSAVENIGLLRGKVREQYLKERTVRVQIGRWSGDNARGTVGSVKCEDWSGFLGSWKSFTKRYLLTQDRESAKSSSSGGGTIDGRSPVALKAAILLRIANTCGIFMTKTSPETVPLLETETMSLLYTTGFPGKKHPPPLTPRELFRCLYALQYSMFANAVVTPHKDSSARSGDNNREILFLQIKDMEHFSMCWLPIFVNSLHVMYTFSAFVLEYVDEFFKAAESVHEQPERRPSEMDMYFCHAIVIGVVNMAALLRPHLAQAMRTQESVVHYVDNMYTHDECNPNSDKYHLHMCHVGLETLVKRLDERIAQLDDYYRKVNSASSDSCGFSFSDVVPVKVEDTLKCASCEAGKSSSCKLNCESTMVSVWSDEHRSSKMLGEVEKRSYSLLFPNGNPARRSTEQKSAAEVNAYVQQAAGTLTEAYIANPSKFTETDDTNMAGLSDAGSVCGNGLSAGMSGTDVEESHSFPSENVEPRELKTEDSGAPQTVPEQNDISTAAPPPRAIADGVPSLGREEGVCATETEGVDKLCLGNEMDQKLQLSDGNVPGERDVVLPDFFGNSTAIDPRTEGALEDEMMEIEDDNTGEEEVNPVADTMPEEPELQPVHDAPSAAVRNDQRVLRMSTFASGGTALWMAEDEKLAPFNSGAGHAAVGNFSSQFDPRSETGARDQPYVPRPLSSADPIWGANVSKGWGPVDPNVSGSGTGGIGNTANMHYVPAEGHYPLQQQRPIGPAGVPASTGQPLAQPPVRQPGIPQQQHHGPFFGNGAQTSHNIYPQRMYEGGECLNHGSQGAHAQGAVGTAPGRQSGLGSHNARYHDGNG